MIPVPVRETSGRHGHVDSHYAATAAMPEHSALAGRLEADVCVVGGGLAGLTAALELARAGKDVVLVEAERIGWAASGRNGGFVSAGYSQSILKLESRLGKEHAQALYRLSADGVDYVRKLIADYGRGDLIGGHGWLKMIRHGDIAVLERQAERMTRDYGAAYRVVGRDELAGFVSSTRYHGGLLDLRPFHIHPLGYAGAVAGAAMQVGARLFERSRVTALARRNGRWVAETAQGTVEAGDVVLATSAYGGPSGRLNASILPVSTYVVTARSSRLDEAIRFEGCLGDTRRAGDYYRLVGSGEDRRLLWGGRITTRQSVPPALGQKLAGDIRSVYPQLDDLVIERAWAGLMGYAVHKMPILGPVEDGLWAASAFGGHGLNTTAMAGCLIATAIAEGDDRWKLFEPFAMRWGGGPLGRAATQLEYWRLQILDRIEESRAPAVSRRSGPTLPN
ncbi:MAG: FAD-binding oxidoreductase [Pseudomonadota bacterium]|nr:FAD-binding oxidoreductase [Pseudomonadota bacterium]